MIRFLNLTVLLTIAVGLALHFQVELPWFADWIGTLPGDLHIKKGGMIIYVPVASSLIISLGLSLVGSLLFSDK